MKKKDQRGVVTRPAPRWRTVAFRVSDLEWDAIRRRWGKQGKMSEWLRTTVIGVP